ncbi:MAG: DUF5655 domain-containing protein [Bacteroidota bacterium]
MASTEEMQKKMLKSIEEKTGLNPETIIADIRSQNLEKHNLKIKFVKEKYALSHGFANLLALKSKLTADENSKDDPIESQYKGKEHLFEIYKEISSFLLSLEGTELVPKKAYVSVKTKKQYAIVQPSTKTRIDLGLKFPKDTSIDLEPSGSFNSMVSHRIRIEQAEDFNATVKNHLEKAYELSR